MKTMEFISELICWAMVTLTSAGTIYAIYVLINASKEDEIYKSTGLITKAKILSIKETGRWAGNNPVAIITAEIIINEKETYISTFTDTIPPINAPAIQPGKEVRVRILPNAPDKAEIIW